MPFADNPHAPFSPAAKDWENTNKIVKPAPPALSDAALFDLVVAANNNHVSGPANPVNPTSPNSVLNAQWQASPANPAHPAHKTFLTANNKKDK